MSLWDFETNITFNNTVKKSILFSNFRPGFTRLNLPYFYSNETIEFILQAVLFVAEHGWKLLPQVRLHANPCEFSSVVIRESVV